MTCIGSTDMMMAIPWDVPYHAVGWSLAPSLRSHSRIDIDGLEIYLTAQSNACVRSYHEVRRQAMVPSGKADNITQMK